MNEFRYAAAFSLTPALSRWERGNPSPSLPETSGWTCRTVGRRQESDQWLFPLPQGEGQGEGERVQSSVSRTNFQRAD